MGKTYRGAVIGYGNLGVRHGEVLHGLDGTELVAVCDSAPEARAKAEEQYPGIALYDDDDPDDPEARIYIAYVCPPEVL